MQIVGRKSVVGKPADPPRLRYSQGQPHLAETATPSFGRAKRMIQRAKRRVKQMIALSSRGKHTIEVTCVLDNSVTIGSQLWGEHGVAFFIATGVGGVLFDTGASGTVLMRNLQVLGIKPEAIDALALSHAHCDHTGGLAALLEHTRPDLPLYANPGLFRERFSRRKKGEPKPVGLSMTREMLEARTTLHLHAEPQEIVPGVWTTGVITDRPDTLGQSVQHVVREGDAWVPDPYQDDASLVVHVEAGLVLLCGCCHAGLSNTIAHVQRVFDRPIVAVAGGTHLARARVEDLQRVIDVLSEMEFLRRVHLNHCSGEMAFHILRRALGSEVVRGCPAGTRLDLESFR
jgi:7,8-dihydropterin-6-yl-methyl-4-(beta-D-ribofuranosyl)aminobenzene 5'-phosphate synthase